MARACEVADMSVLFDSLFQKFGPSLNFGDAAPLLSYPSVEAARQSRARGTFPLPVRQAGSRLIVSVLDVAKFLDGELSPPLRSSRRGAPRKAERLAKQAAQAAAALSTSTQTNQK